MRKRALAGFTATLMATSCAPAEPTADVPMATARPTVTVAARASATITGQPIAMPPAPFEAVVSVTELPPGGVLPMHKHPWPRYAFVDRGRLRVSYEAAGFTREFGPGEAVVEAIDQWHEGRVIGSEPVRLIVFDQAPPGTSNVVLR